jgi:hypothetical protein
MCWRNVSLAASSAALLLALAGCGGDDGERASGPRIDGPTADQLAETSERIADLVAEGDECGAAQEADRLYNDAQRAIAENRVPPALAADLEARAVELQNELSCDDVPPPPPPAPPPPPPPPPPPDGDD